MKILLADSHTLFREGFSRQLQRFESATDLREVTDINAVRALADANEKFDLCSSTAIFWANSGAMILKR